MTRLKLWRLQRGMTQQDVAARCGLGLSAYSLIESGRLIPSDAQAAALEALFKVAADKLLCNVPDDLSAPLGKRVL